MPARSVAKALSQSGWARTIALVRRPLAEDQESQWSSDLLAAHEVHRDKIAAALSGHIQGLERIGIKRPAQTFNDTLKRGIFPTLISIGGDHGSTQKASYRTKKKVDRAR
jgi:hypothetical protein